MFWFYGTCFTFSAVRNGGFQQCLGENTNLVTKYCGDFVLVNQLILDERWSGVAREYFVNVVRQLYFHMLSCYTEWRKTH